MTPEYIAAQQSLNTIYERLRQVAKIPAEFETKISAPLCIHCFPKWFDSSHRVLIVGQETYGWGINPQFHGPGGIVCSPCPYPQMMTFADWKASDQAVEAMVHVYEVFDFARTQPENHRSPFWRACRAMVDHTEEKNPNRAFLWSNLFRMDWDGGSVLTANQTVRQALRSAQRTLLRDEIRILRPRVVVFFTGPDYEEELQSEFDQLEFHPIGDARVEELAVLRDQDGLLPEKSFRTYHPSYLQRAGKWSYLDLIRDRIFCS